MKKTDIRPYLVIPKMIEQPTWGGTYIPETKGWQDRPGLKDKKIGQSYELYDKSNLSLITDSSSPDFQGELTDNKGVEQQTSPNNSIPLSSILEKDVSLLLKFTQALGNSFQLHIKDGMSDPKWKAKPESWYYFEPGLITCGVKKDTNWQDYQKAITELDGLIKKFATHVQDGSITYEQARSDISILVKQYNPWQYVNLVRVEKGTLLDLSPCGIHHSWEEDLSSIPLGNVLYEIQLNVMDDVATIRNFDKGKITKDGKLRPLQIDDYFALVDRSPEANDPETHMRKSMVLVDNDQFCHERLLQSKYYTMDKIEFKQADTEFSEAISSFRHIFVKSGVAKLRAGEMVLRITAGHSAFIPSDVHNYVIHADEPKSTVLISY